MKFIFHELNVKKSNVSKSKSLSTTKMQPRIEGMWITLNGLGKFVCITSTLFTLVPNLDFLKLSL
jgi:hypothetical protein